VIEVSQKQLDLPSEYDSAVKNIDRFLNLGWLMISLYVAISLVYFSGAEYRSVIVYALGAPLTYLLTSWIKREPWNQIRLIPVMIYIFWLPILVDIEVKYPWYSIGLIATCAALSSIMFKNRINSILFVLLCVLGQYFLASQEMVGVSDSKDTLLLNSYFSSLWVAICGLAGLLIVKNYFKYCLELDDNLKDVEIEYWERSQSISRLNLKDYINLKLHGTILNTLIFAQKMSGLTSKETISEQLKSDLSQLESVSVDSESISKIGEMVKSNIGFGRLNVSINENSNVIFSSVDAEIAIELIREVVLNVNKHTNSSKLTINISGTENNRILITINEELEMVAGAKSLASKAVAAMTSKSMQRLCKESGSDYSVNSYSTGSLLHVITINSIERDLDIIRETKEIRRKSLNSFVNNISSISVVFALFSVPGFLYLQVPAPMIIVVVSCLAVHAYLLRGSADVFLISILTFLPLTLIPYAYTTSEVCTNLSSLPWIVNSLLGAFLFGTYSSPSVILRWLPGFIMFAECLSANFLLPNECSSLLNGTTPGIAIALILARNLMSRRSRNMSLDKVLEGKLRMQSDLNLDIQEKITISRNRVLEKVRTFSDDQFGGDKAAKDLDNLINLVRAYLLCSEKFERPYFQDMFDWVLKRYESGINTKIEIYEINESVITYNMDFNSDFGYVTGMLKDKDLKMTVTIGERISVELQIDVQMPLNWLERVNQNGSQIQFSDKSR
jgi:hypothetical protein